MRLLPLLAFSLAACGPFAPRVFYVSQAEFWGHATAR